MRIDIVTKEFPPEIYGGAGVHVAELSRVLASQVDLQVHAFGAPRPADFHGATVTSYAAPAELAGANAAVQTLGVDLRIVPDIAGADLVHSHTWYANMAGHLASLLHGIPHVLSAHSLEPLRPWKAEQLGGGYAVSSWVEKTAYEAAAAIIAVSDGMRQDILRSYPDVDPAKVKVVHNGIDVATWQQRQGRRRRPRPGHRSAPPSVVWVGRVTRQKGVPYLLKAAAQLPPEVQLVLCAGAADTPELAAEVNAADRGPAGPARRRHRDRADAATRGAHRGAQPRHCLRLPVHLRAAGHREPGGDGLRRRRRRQRHRRYPRGGRARRAPACWCRWSRSPTGPAPLWIAEKFVRDFADALNAVVADPDRARAMGQKGRRRVQEHFSWDSIARTTLDIYRSVL